MDVKVGQYQRQWRANRLEAMEMWCYRRMMEISWMKRKTNEEVLQLVGESRSMMKSRN